MDLQEVMTFVWKDTSSWNGQHVLLLTIFRLLVLTLRSIKYLHNEQQLVTKQ